MTDPCRGTDGGMLSLDEARRRVVADVSPMPRRERLPLRAALGRILAGDFPAPLPLPNWRNSAMDGYALRSGDIAPKGESRLKVKGVSWAGRPFAGTLNHGECVRVFTGAVLPDDADTVVMQEQVRQDGDTVLISGPLAVGTFVREPGEDIPAGATALTAGRRLTPADLGLLAALGYCEIGVRQRPRVAFFSTGDELQPAGASLQPGEIYDSNRTLLYALLSECGVEALDLGRVPDRLEETRTALNDGAKLADVVIATGGASVGEADLLREALLEQGELSFWRVAIKPGKPFIHGRVGNARFFGLPGNPVSVWITFRQLVRPVLDKLAGAIPSPPLRLPARCREALRKEPGRLEFKRGSLESDATGQLWVRALAGQGAHQLKSLCDADCLILLPAESSGVSSGDTVWVEPLGRG